MNAAETGMSATPLRTPPSGYTRIYTHTARCQKGLRSTARDMGAIMTGAITTSSPPIDLYCLRTGGTCHSECTVIGRAEEKEQRRNQLGIKGHLLGDAGAGEQVAVRRELDAADDVRVLPLALRVQRALEGGHLREARRARLCARLPLGAPLPGQPAVPARTSSNMPG